MTSPVEQIRAWIARAQAFDKAKRDRATRDNFERRMREYLVELEALHARFLDAEAGGSQEGLAADIDRARMLSGLVDRLFEERAALGENE